MNVDNLREDLRKLQNSIYISEDNVILNNFLSFEKNLMMLGLVDNNINTSLDGIKDSIFNENINKKKLFNETIIIDNQIESYSMEYHKKNNK